MPPKNQQVTYTDSSTDLISSEGTTRFQWHWRNPNVTVLFFKPDGPCDNVRDVPKAHARYLWSKLINSGWTRKV